MISTALGCVTRCSVFPGFPLPRAAAARVVGPARCRPSFPCCGLAMLIGVGSNPVGGDCCPAPSPGSDSLLGACVPTTESGVSGATVGCSLPRIWCLSLFPSSPPDLCRSRVPSSGLCPSPTNPTSSAPKDARGFAPGGYSCRLSAILVVPLVLA